MLGNDVVDLEDRETAPGAAHPRFDERVFAAEELEWLRRSRSPGRLRWVLWAAKESAYKAAKKLDPRTIFSPRRFVVRLEASNVGWVRLGERRFSIVARVERAVCHVIACAELPRGVIVVSGLRRLVSEACKRPPLPGRAVRRFALDEMTPWLGVRAGDLELVSEGRVPRLRLGGRPVPADVSLSHHGRFIAFACAVGGLSVRASA
jgi:phosphopantetheinyl transferase (holo-ACP synthase)